MCIRDSLAPAVYTRASTNDVFPDPLWPTTPTFLIMLGSVTANSPTPSFPSLRQQVYNPMNKKDAQPKPEGVLAANDVTMHNPGKTVAHRPAHLTYPKKTMVVRLRLRMPRYHRPSILQPNYINRDPLRTGFQLVASPFLYPEHTPQCYGTHFNH